MIPLVSTFTTTQTASPSLRRRFTCWVGHASIITTERYDNQRLEMLQAAVARLEDGKDFDAGTDAADKVSRIFQDPVKASLAEGSEASKEILRSN